MVGFLQGPPTIQALTPFIFGLKDVPNSHENKEIRKVHDCHSFDEARLRKAMKHIHCGDKSFVDNCFVDSNIKCFNRVDFIHRTMVFSTLTKRIKKYTICSRYTTLT